MSSRAKTVTETEFAILNVLWDGGPTTVREIVEAVGRQDQITNVLRVDRHLEIESVLYGAHRGDPMDRGANTTDALSEKPGITRIAILENDLDAAHHRSGGIGLLDLVAIHLRFNSQVTFDSGDRVNYNSFIGHVCDLSL